jgi:hypothetical protein
MLTNPYSMGVFSKITVMSASHGGFKNQRTLTLLKKLASYEKLAVTALI